jgi:hypothetical protein
MQFRNPHDLLAYLVDLSNSDRAWKLSRGQDLVDAARDDGLLEWNESEISQLARYLWMLKGDGSVTFQDYAGTQIMGGRKDWVGLTHNDISQAANITVTSHGRIAAQSARPMVAINVAKIDLTVLLSAVEEEVAASDAPDEVKDEARTKLRAARDVLVGVGSGATAEVLAAALRRTLGLP